MHTLFISDLHLSNERPDKLNLFKNLLNGRAREADAIYILGDLFEAWAGDDDDTPPHPEIISTLANFTGQGKTVYLMRGNRDYLLGNTFARKTGVTTILDPTEITLYGTRILLMHGDTLCTRDVKYQIFRRIINNSLSIKIFMLLPFLLRKRIWHGIRSVTRNTTTRKSPYLIDVHQPAVEKIMCETGIAVLIHGHTHKEGIHEFTLNGEKATRYVLGDWYENDSVLVADKNGLHLMDVKSYLDDD